MKRSMLRMTPFIVFIGLALFFWRGLSLDPHDLPSTRIDKVLPTFNLPPLEDKQPSFSSTTLRGQVSLLNVWASWCMACMDEQPFLMKLANQGVLIYGLNYKDKIPDARDWLANWGNPYRLVGADTSGRTAIELGVYGAPETFIVDKKGMIRFRYVGILDAKVWEAVFVPRMKQLEKG